MNLNRYTSEVTWRQEDYALPLFVRLTDVLRPIRLRIDSIKGWPPRIESALRIVIESFDATAAAWGWERVVEPERDAYINERIEWFLETVERPVYEAALSMQAGFRGLKRFRDVDDLADKGRDLGFQATMTSDEGEAQYPLACERWHKTPRMGTCYPRIGEREKKNLGGAYNLIVDTLKIVARATPARSQESVAPPEWEKPAPEAPPVALDGPDKEVVVWGQRMDPLPDAEYRVVEALVAAYASGQRLSMTSLQNRTKDARGNVVEDPVGALKRLRKKDEVWKQAIAMSGKARLGYTLKARPPTTHVARPDKPPTKTR
jgi:hypothetical protein